MEELNESKHNLELQLQEALNEGKSKDSFEKIVAYFDSVQDKVQLLTPIKECLTDLKRQIKVSSENAENDKLKEFKQLLSAKDCQVVLLTEELQALKAEICGLRANEDKLNILPELSVNLTAILSKLEENSVNSSNTNDIGDKYDQLVVEFEQLKAEKEQLELKEKKSFQEILKLKSEAGKETLKWKDLLLKHQSDLRQAEAQIELLQKQRDDLMTNANATNAVDKDDDDEQENIMLEAIYNLENEVSKV